HPNQVLRILAELAMLFEMACGHARIAICFGVARKSLLLFLARAADAFADRCRIFFRTLAGDVAVIDRRDFDVQIDPIEQWSGNALTIALHLNGAATAFPF